VHPHLAYASLGPSDFTVNTTSQWVQRFLQGSPSRQTDVLRAVVLTQYRRVTDGQTDRQTDGIAVASTALAMRRAVIMLAPHQAAVINRTCQKRINQFSGHRLHAYSHETINVQTSWPIYRCYTQSMLNKIRLTGRRLVNVSPDNQYSLVIQRQQNHN